MEKTEYVTLPLDLSHDVERLFFEYMASLSVSRYLMSQDGIRESMMQMYLDAVECKWIELEMLKQRVVKEYPSTFEYANYEFEFDASRIKYTEKEVE